MVWRSVVWVLCVECCFSVLISWHRLVINGMTDRPPPASNRTIRRNGTLRFRNTECHVVELLHNHREVHPIWMSETHCAVITECIWWVLHNDKPLASFSGDDVLENTIYCVTLRNSVSDCANGRQQVATSCMCVGFSWIRVHHYLYQPGTASFLHQTPLFFFCKWRGGHDVTWDVRVFSHNPSASQARVDVYRKRGIYAR